MALIEQEDLKRLYQDSHKAALSQSWVGPFPLRSPEPKTTQKVPHPVNEVNECHWPLAIRPAGLFSRHLADFIPLCYFPMSCVYVCTLEVSGLEQICFIFDTKNFQYLKSTFSSAVIFFLR